MLIRSSLGPIALPRRCHIDDTTLGARAFLPENRQANKRKSQQWFNLRDDT